MVKPNHAAENALATIGAVCWTIQILPQIIKSWREKSTHGLSTWLMLCVPYPPLVTRPKADSDRTWALSCLPFGSYIVAQKLSIPLQIQPHAFGFLCTISVSQCLYYNQKWSFKKTMVFLVGFLTVWAGFETGSVYALWVSIFSQNFASSVLRFRLVWITVQPPPCNCTATSLPSYSLELYCTSTFSIRKKKDGC